MYKRTSKRVWIAVLGGSILLLVLSKSKTSMGLLIPSLIIGQLFGYAHRHGRSRVALVAVLMTIALVAALVVFGLSGQFADLFDNPEAFTGRGAIWAASLSMIADRPVLGFGYGSVFVVGPASPWFDYAAGWAVEVAHGHNGYLDILSSIGLVGFVLFLLAFVVDPVRSLLSVSSSNSTFVGFLASLLAFLLLHNTMESSFLDRARPEWVVLLLVCALARRAAISSRTPKA